jgi:hypothetical protein
MGHWVKKKKERERCGWPMAWVKEGMEPWKRKCENSAAAAKSRHIHHQPKTLTVTFKLKFYNEHHNPEFARLIWQHYAFTEQTGTVLQRYHIMKWFRSPMSIFVDSFQVWASYFGTLLRCYTATTWVAQKKAPFYLDDVRERIGEKYIEE